MSEANIFILIPIVLGLTTILQTHIVKKMSETYSLFQAAFINNLTGLVLIGLIYYFSSDKKEFAASQFQPLFLLAGLFGVFFVLGAPFAVSKIGPARFFIILVAAQILSSLVWQYFSDPVDISTKKIVAAVLVFVGAYLSI